MHWKTKSGQLANLPTDAEDAKINAGMAADPDNPEWTDEDFARARPASEVLFEIFPPEVAAAMLKPRGSPRLANPKVHLNLRVDADIVEKLKSTGPGWQARVNEMLRAWVEAR